MFDFYSYISTGLATAFVSVIFHIPDQPMRVVETILLATSHDALILSYVLFSLKDQCSSLKICSQECVFRR